jgi:hypothetical protein
MLIAAVQSKQHASMEKVENRSKPSVRSVTSAKLWHFPPPEPFSDTIPALSRCAAVLRVRHLPRFPLRQR